MPTTSMTKKRRADRRPTLRAAEATLSRGERAEAAEILTVLPETLPADLEGLRRLLRVSMEVGSWDRAIAVVEAARGRRGAGAAALLIEAEYHIGNDALDAARHVLGRAPKDNVVLPALALLLDYFAAPKEERGTLKLEPYVLWFEPVLVHLLAFLERELEQREPTHELHAVRSSLFQPVPASKPSFLRRFFRALSGAKRRESEQREQAVDDRLAAGDVAGAVALLREWIADEPAAGADFTTLAAFNLLAMLFALDRFDEVVALNASMQNPMKGDVGTQDCPEGLPFVAYAYLAIGDTVAARSLIAAGLGDTPGSAELAHLGALVEGVGEGTTNTKTASRSLARTIPWIRRAFQADDIALVELAERELGLVNGDS